MMKTTTQTAIQLAYFRIFVNETKYWSGLDRTDDAHAAIKKAAASTISFSVLIYVATAIGVSLSTKELDERADKIVTGTGLLISAVAITALGYRMVTWLGVYHVKKSKKDLKKAKRCITIKQLKFDVVVSLLWIFFANAYFLMSLQFCNASPETVPVSAILGLLAGFAVFYGVYKARTTYKKYKKQLALSFTVILSLCASTAFGYGMYYIQTVWEQDNGFNKNHVLVSMFFAWAILCVVLNYFIWRYQIKKTQRLMQESENLDYLHDDMKFKTEMFVPRKQRGDLCNTPSTSGGSNNNNNSKPVLPDDDGEGDDVAEGAPLSKQATKKETGHTEKLSSAFAESSSKLGHGKEVVVNVNQDLEKQQASHDNTELEVSLLDVGVNGNHSDTTMNGGDSPDDRIQQQKNDTTENDDDIIANNKNQTNGTTTDDINHAENSEETTSLEGGHEVEKEKLEEMMKLVKATEESESIYKMIGKKCPSCCRRRCCCCVCPKELKEETEEEERESKSCGMMTLNIFKGFVVFIVNLFCIYFTVVNIGATNEQIVVRINLPSATRALYPPDYQNGTMCAWDEATPNGTIKTFDTLEEVYDAGWSVVHCEACSNCSNWNDMKIQWETRETMAAQAQRW